MQISSDTLLAYLAGILTATSGAYLADKYTDRRREKELKAKADDEFRQIAARMPNLIKKMQSDLAKPEFRMIRSFFVLPNRNVVFGFGSKKDIIYYESEHEDLMHAVRLLEDNGYITNVADTNTPRYWMTEHFVKYVREFDGANIPQI
ncbi:MAG: hypothetical protein WC421_00200 [Elusimicrobiales bacterium]